MSMKISHYLAMTAAEVGGNADIPHPLAYMACHFSPYGTGLSNIPDRLPAGSMLILNDRTPIAGHDSSLIAEQLAQTAEHLKCSCILLDFERPDIPQTAVLCHKLSEVLSLPVGVSSLYAKDLQGPVFLPPSPLDQPLADHLSPWQGREIWLEAALDSACITVTKDGSSISSLPFSPPPEDAFAEDSLHCRYRAEVLEHEIRFHLWRDREQLDGLLKEAEALSVSTAVSLYQQLAL